MQPSKQESVYICSCGALQHRASENVTPVSITYIARGGFPCTSQNLSMVRRSILRFSAFASVSIRNHSHLVCCTTFKTVHQGSNFKKCSIWEKDCPTPVMLVRNCNCQRYGFRDRIICSAEDTYRSIMRKRRVEMRRSSCTRGIYR